MHGNSLKRLLAVDPSLTCSGWALFRLQPERLLGIGKIRSLSPKLSLSERLKDLQEKITELFTSLKLGNGDVLVCEAPTTMRDPRAAFKVEQVRGIFETLARNSSITVPGRLNPRSVQREIMGLSGKQLKRAIVKETAVQVVRTLYKDSLVTLGFEDELEKLKRHQDIVDAILIGSLASVRVQAAFRAQVALESVFEGSQRSLGSRGTLRRWE